MKTNIAKALNTYRSMKGLSQKELSERAQLPQSAISDIETGKRKNPGIKTLAAIASALDVTVSKLLNEEDNDLV